MALDHRLNIFRKITHVPHVKRIFVVVINRDPVVQAHDRCSQNGERSQVNVLWTVVGIRDKFAHLISQNQMQAMKNELADV